MFRFLFRLLALAALSVAVIFSVLDATRSIAASALVMTPLRESWVAVSPHTLDSARDLIVGKLHPLLWDPAMIRILDMPGFLVFAVLAFLLGAVGRRPARREARLTA